MPKAPTPTPDRSAQRGAAKASPSAAASPEAATSAATTSAAAHRGAPIRPADVPALQRTLGNRAVQRMLAPHRPTPPIAPRVPPSGGAVIQRKIGPNSGGITANVGKKVVDSAGQLVGEIVYVDRDTMYRIQKPEGGYLLVTATNSQYHLESEWKAWREAKDAEPAPEPAAPARAAPPIVYTLPPRQAPDNDMKDVKRGVPAAAPERGADDDGEDAPAAAAVAAGPVDDAEEPDGGDAAEVASEDGDEDAAAAPAKADEKKVVVKGKVYGWGDVVAAPTPFHSDEMRAGKNTSPQEVRALIKDPRVIAKLKAMGAVNLPSGIHSNWIEINKLTTWKKGNVRIDIENVRERGAVVKWQRVKIQPDTGQQGGWLFYIGDGKTPINYSTDIMVHSIDVAAKGSGQYILVFPKEAKLKDSVLPGFTPEEVKAREAAAAGKKKPKQGNAPAAAAASSSNSGRGGRGGRGGKRK